VDSSVIRTNLKFALHLTVKGEFLILLFLQRVDDMIPTFYAPNISHILVFIITAYISGEFKLTSLHRQYQQAMSLPT
jgi:hypothetical protein